MLPRMSIPMSLGIVWALLCFTKINADPPETEPAPPVPAVATLTITANDNKVVAESNGTTLEATSLQFQDASIPQVQIETVIYAVDPAVLKKLAEDAKAPVAGLLQRNGFKFLDSSEQPQRAGAVRTGSHALDLMETDISAACTILSRPAVRTQVGSEASVTVGEAQVVDQNGWCGTKLTVLPVIDQNGLIVMNVRLEEADRKSVV